MKASLSTAAFAALLVQQGYSADTQRTNIGLIAPYEYEAETMFKANGDCIGLSPIIFGQEGEYV